MTVRARGAPHPGVAGGALGGPVVIPRAKIRTPVARTGQVHRDRLLEPLADTGADLVLVLAPAGFGKTTFIAQWAGQTGNRVAWAMVTETDSDPVVLFKSPSDTSHTPIDTGQITLSGGDSVPRWCLDRGHADTQIRVRYGIGIDLRL